MSHTLELEDDHMANLNSAYVPTLPTPDDAKNEFYNQLDQIISRTLQVKVNHDGQLQCSG